MKRSDVLTTISAVKPVSIGTMLENYRLLLCVSRLYGCHPHTINERLVFANFRPLLIYSLIVCGMYCGAAYYVTGISGCFPSNIMIVGCILQRINRYSRSFYMIATVLLSCLRHTKFERFVATACKFDDLTRHYRWCTGTKQTNRCVQWLIILVILIAWSLLGILGKFIVPQVSIPTMIMQCMMRATFLMEIVKFCVLYDTLRRRFRRLNGLCRGLIGVAVGVDTGNGIGVHTERLTISNLHRLHQCLTNATNYLSSYYSPQLLCWIACLLTDIITYVFATLYGVNSRLSTCLQFIMLLYLSFQIIIISCVCHLICYQANALAGTIEISAFNYTESLTEAIELRVFLRAHPLRVRVCGLFNLNNQFTFSAFGVILMYVILASSIY